MNDLTPTQIAILQMAANDLRDKQIAGALEITFDGVRHHWRAIYRKLDCTTRTGAVARGYHFWRIAQPPKKA